MVILMIMENINVTVMRNTIKPIMLVAAAAMTFASCQKEIASPQPLSKVLTMHADVETTKTYLDEDNQVLWGTGESVHLYVGAGETQKFVNSTPTDEYNGKTSASFSFELGALETSDEYCLGGVYPASVVVASNNTKSSQFKVQLPATQTSVNGNYDPSAYIMVLKPDVVDELPTEYTASFRRATALNKITLTNVAEDITSVEITVPEGKYLAGRRYFNLTTGESGDIYESGSETNVVKVNGDFKAGIVDLWFCSWGVELVENEKIIVKMTSATKSYTRSITVRAEGINFQEGDLNTLKINMGSNDTIVETLSKIEGDYLIASKTKDGWFLMTPTNGGSYYSATSSVSTSESVSASDFYLVDNIEDYVWRVSKYGIAYSIMSVHTNKYIGYSGSSNQAYAHELGESAAMDIQLDNQLAVIESKNVSGRKLKYNAGSPRFAFYTSAQTDVYMIPWIPDTTPRIKVESTDIEVKADATEVSFDYELKNTTGTVIATVGNSTMEKVDATVDGNTVRVTFDANEDAEEKSSTIVLSIAGADDVNVTITQAAYVDSGEGDDVVIESGTVLWSDDWGKAGSTSTTFSSNTTISSYDYSGRDGYGDNATAVTYTSDAGNNVRITKSSSANCVDGHLWFNKSVAGELKTSAIKLYGVTSLTFSHSQGTSGSSCTSSYSIDGGVSWTNLGTQSGAIAVKTYSFSVPEGTDSIIIKLSHPSSNNKNTRVDNLILKAN